MKVSSTIAAFALTAVASAVPHTQQIEERQAPTCGVVGNDRGWYIYSQTGQTITNCYNLCQQRSECLSYSFGQTRCRLYNDYAVNQVVRNAAAPYTFYGKGCARPATTTTRRTTTTTRPPTTTTRPIATTTRPSTTTTRPITTASSVRPTSSTTSRGSTTYSRPASSTTSRAPTTAFRASTTVAVTTSSSSSSSRPMTSSTTSRAIPSITSAGSSADSTSVRSSTTTSSKYLLTDPLDPATAGPILTSTSRSSSGTSSGSSGGVSSGLSSSTSSRVFTSAVSRTSTVLSSGTSMSRPASSSTTSGVSTTGNSSATSTVSTTRSTASSTPSYTRSYDPFTLSSTTRSSTHSITRSTTRSTTSTTSTACKPVPTASSGKRGLSFNDPKFTNLFSATSCTPDSVGRSRTSWAYNWFSAPCDNLDHASLCSVPFNPYLEFIPMLWSNDRNLQNVWNSNVQAAAARGWKTVLAFNEPDIAHSGGSGMSIADAVISWKQYIQPLKAQGFRLGSPAVTNAQGLNMGNDWQVKFLDQTPGNGGCIGCTVDFLAVHWYGGPTDFQSFFDHVAYSWTTVGKQRLPVWVTEFGITGGTDAQVENFLRVVIDAFENQPYWSFVERYAWFTASNSSPTSGPLVAANGTSLSRAGQVYENQV